MAELSVRVTPRSSSNRVQIVNGKVKAWVSAPPVDGEANLAVIKLISDFLGVPKSTVSISRGHSSRDKVLEISGLTEADLQGKLGILVEGMASDG